MGPQYTQSVAQVTVEHLGNSMLPRMHTILDLDLDVFSHPAVRGVQPNGRPSDADHICASPADVNYFLETQCGLSKENRIPGKEFRDHEDAFNTWRHWIQEKLLNPQFSVVHVDAHADMGNGDSGYIYLLTELLAVPVEQRRNPRCGLDALNSANYLMFAVANQWLHQLTYVYPHLDPWTANWKSGFSKNIREHTLRNGLPADLMRMHFLNYNCWTRTLQLKHRSRETFSWGLPFDSVISFEPTVPFDFTPLPSFQFDGFTHMVVAQSPNFAPPSADNLLPIIRQFFLAS